MSSPEKALRRVNPLLFRGFLAIARRRLRRNFRAVRLAHSERMPALTGNKPVIFYLNHPSWWDPLVGFAAAANLVPGRAFYAPMDSVELKRYGVLRSVGLFPVELNTTRGAAQFLETGMGVLRRAGVLAVTPQGKFTDVRERPLELKPGLAALLRRLQRSGMEVPVVPLAVEYTFWNQRLPEVLLCVGETFSTMSLGAQAVTEDWNALVTDRLEAAQIALQALSIRREASVFQTILEGSRGVAGFYGMFQTMQAGHRRHDHGR